MVSVDDATQTTETRLRVGARPRVTRWRRLADDPRTAVLRQPLLIIGGVALAAVAGYCDYLTDGEISIPLLYLGPISWAVWFIGLRPAVFVSIASAGTWLAIDLARQGGDSPMIHYYNLALQLCVFLIFTGLLAAFKERLDREKLLARTDPLTHLPNRRAFLESMAREVDRARRMQLPFTLAYFDIDDLKTINDQLGHREGDIVLVAVAEIFRSGCRDTDLVGRLRDDEFCLFFAETDREGAERVIERLRERLATAMLARQYTVTFSVGAATFLASADTVEEMIAHTDELMLQVKQTGKNNVRHEIFQRAKGHYEPTGDWKAVPRRTAPQRVH